MRTEKITLILLAAGDSRRFDGNKLLYELDGKPMYCHLADRMLGLKGSVFDEICVVSQYDEILDCLAPLGCRAVKNTRSDLGIAHSIRLGLDRAKTGNGCCFAVCDQPWLRAETVEAFVREWRASGKGMGCLGFGERQGNPAVFAPEYRAELLELKGDTGGRKVIKKHPEDLYVFQVSDEAELMDVDTREEACYFTYSTKDSAPSE